MKIRNYTPKDKHAVIDLFRSNTPQYFDVSEEVDLLNYLEQEIEDYFVVEDGGKVLGAGGINYVPKERRAVISWDMISEDQHGKGIGRQILAHRIERIKGKSDIDQIIVRTSQHAYEFYGKSGFQLVQVEKDYWAKGFDLYFMKMDN